jgi:hypothetical protein
MTQAARKLQFMLFAILAACTGAVLPGEGVHPIPPSRLTESPMLLPPNLLYVTGGPTSTRHPFIAVFNAQDKSPSPQPIYTISPKGGGEYGLFAVDASNDLFAVNYFANGAELLVFPSGKAKPTTMCLLDNAPRGIYITHATLYLTTALYTIEEYSLPIHAGKTCPSPNRVLTDQRAQLRGTLGLWAVAVDPTGDVFDVWQSQNGQRIDEFRVGSKAARRFASLGQTYGAFAMTSDASGDLITNISGTGSQWNSIAVFPHGSHRPKRFQPIPNGQYLGVAVAGHGTELFAAKDYPATAVGVYAYDQMNGHVGSLLRSFPNVWYYAQSIAVFSRK